MREGPYSPYTRLATWAALFSQHINAGYAIVPNSLTSNSLVMISFPTDTENMPKTVQDKMKELLEAESDLYRFFARRNEGERIPAIDKTSPALLREAAAKNRLRVAVVLARSSDYYRYHLSNYLDINQVVCGLHDSYLHVPCWETRTNTRYKPRETSIAIDSPDFEKLRTTAYGHKILLGALVCGDEKAIAFKKTLNARTQRRINAEVRTLQTDTYQGRPLSFNGEAKRREVGAKISQRLLEYHAHKNKHA